MFKLAAIDAYELKVDKFERGADMLLSLSEPVYMENDAPYRIRLYLKGYVAAVQKNESVIRLVVVVDNETYASEEIYLGIIQFNVPSVESEKADLSAVAPTT